MTRQRPPGEADERLMLTGWLDWQRATVRLKCAGLSDEQAQLAAQDPLELPPVPHASLNRLLDEYDAQCARSREIVAAHALDDIEACAPEGLDLVSLRWIVTHLVEETARHLGHLNALRELTDGTTGY